MASANPRLGYHRPHPDSNPPSYFDGDDSAVLDPAILDADIMQSPKGAPFRKGSLANSNGVLSPADSHAWDQHYAAGLPVEAAAHPNPNAYHDDNGFVRPNAPHGGVQQGVYGHPPPGVAWTYEQAPSVCQPGASADFMAPPVSYEPMPYAQHRTDSAPASMPPPSMAPLPPAYHTGPGFMPAPQVQPPMSPHSHEDWMAMAQREIEGRPMSKRMRPNSPSSAMADYARRDGIRKKNGRIDIPQERNIHTIDELIDRTTDEDMLKELKQQKRLLRNREAALQSRQRKKKHTEDLEGREKNYTAQINMLEKEVNDLSIERQHREEERQMLHHQLQNSQRAVESLQEQIRALKMHHNEETSQLRRRLNILTEQAEFQAPAMSAVPSSTGFTDVNADMEALSMGPHWDDFLFVEDLRNDNSDDFLFSSIPDPVKQSPVLEKRPSNSTIVPQKKAQEHPSEQPIATGLLFMLLLCGAFVASKPANSRPAGLPSMPPEVQAAAPAVLENLLADSGAHTQLGSVSTAHGGEPQPSGRPHVSQRSGRLDQMHQQLTTPSKQQEIDQAFSLTTAQYASITQMNYQPLDQPQDGRRPRRVLAEALASLQEEQQRNNTAEVYTRSLLWSQIPTETVKQWKELVRHHEEMESRQRQAYKPEP